MRDTFLVFLMAIATGMIGTGIWLGWRMVHEDVADGCFGLLLVIVLFGAGLALLTAVGHVVGVNIPHQGW